MAKRSRHNVRQGSAAALVGRGSPQVAVMEYVLANTNRSSPSHAKPRRSEVPPGRSLCEYCTAKCCRYFAVQIETPTTWQEFDYIRWFLMHYGAAVFTEQGGWYLLVHSPCKHLRDDNRCGIYERRPNICRQYATDNCEYPDDWVYEQYWETAEQIEEYAEAVLGPRDAASFRTPKPTATVVAAR